MNIHKLGRVGAVVAAATLIALQLFNGAVLATVPMAHITTTATPTAVSPGDVAGFVITFTNDDTSTISKVNLSAVMYDGNPGLPTDTGYPAANQVAYSVSSAIPSQGSCNQTGTPLSCKLGMVKPQQTVTIVVGLTTPADLTSVFTVIQASSGGSTPSDGGTSHGDYWYGPATQTILTSDPDFAGRFVAKSSLTTVSNYQVVSSTNPHATKVVAPTTQIPVTVQDGTSTTIDCIDFSCPVTFGQVSEVNVDNGTTFTTAFQVIVTFDSSEIPPGVNQGNIDIYHQWTDTNGTHDELISARCTFAKGSSVPSNVPCVVVQKLPGNDLQVTIWTYHNGGFKGGI